jgi:hypothetical protein
MGADYIGQEEGIREIRALTSEAKEVINHHLNNSLTVILGALEIGRADMAKSAIEHILGDLEMFGIRQPNKVVSAINQLIKQMEEQR